MSKKEYFPKPKHLDISDIDVKKMRASSDILTNVLLQYGYDLDKEEKDENGLCKRFARGVNGEEGPEWFNLLSWTREAEEYFWNKLREVYKAAPLSEIRVWSKHGKTYLHKTMKDGPGIMTLYFPSEIKFKASKYK